MNCSLVPRLHCPAFFHFGFTLEKHRPCFSKVQKTLGPCFFPKCKKCWAVELGNKAKLIAYKDRKQGLTGLGLA